MVDKAGLFGRNESGRVLQAAVRKASGRTMEDLTGALRVKPQLRCVKLFPVARPAG